MDPELAAASVLIRRVDLVDIHAARALIDLEHTLHMPAEPGPSSDVEFVDTTTSGRGQDPPVGVRVYRPVRSRTGLKLPAVVFMHGGAFMTGDLATEHDRCMRYSRDVGCVVVSVDYRLAPEHPYPAGVNDCFTALVWTVEQADVLGIDPDQVAVAGCSAGGALAAVTVLRARDAGGPRVALQMLIYPVIDDTASTLSARLYTDTPGWDSRNNAVMWACYLEGSSKDTYVAPARAIDLSGLPPTFILTAQFDPLRDEALDYGRRLLDAGVMTEIHQVAGTFHGFDGAVPGAAISQRSLDEQSYFLSRYLRPR